MDHLPVVADDVLSLVPDEPALLIINELLVLHCGVLGELRRELDALRVTAVEQLAQTTTFELTQNLDGCDQRPHDSLPFLSPGGEPGSIARRVPPGRWGAIAAAMPSPS